MGKLICLETSKARRIEQHCGRAPWLPLVVQVDADLPRVFRGVEIHAYAEAGVLHVSEAVMGRMGGDDSGR